MTQPSNTEVAQGTKCLQCPPHSSCDLSSPNSLSWFQLLCHHNLIIYLWFKRSNDRESQSRGKWKQLHLGAGSSGPLSPAITVPSSVSLLTCLPSHQATFQYVSLSVFTYVCHTCLSPSTCPVFLSGLSSCLTRSVYLPLSFRLSRCNLT